MLSYKLREVGGLLGAATLAFFPATLAAQEVGDAQANNPLAQTTSLNFQNQYTGSITNIDGDANSLLLRYAKPFSAFGGQWISRFTLPINTGTLPDGSSETAIGDFNFFAAYLFDTGDPAVSFGFGPSLTAPTATDDRLGSEKWSVGFANVLFNARNPKFQWGYLLQWQISVAGSDSRDDINIGAFQPFGFYQLGKGWYLRSTGIWTYDFENDAYAIPVGLGVGRVVKLERATLNAFIEPQYSIATGGDGQSEWGVYAGLNFQF